MNRPSGFSSPLLLGFDELERMLDRVGKAGSDGYPPYNVERIAARDGRPEQLRIILAVAGFSEADLDIGVERDQLTIRGQQADCGERHFLHRGIAARQFQRVFVLAPGMEVAGADLKDGLLTISLIRHEPEKSRKRIEIGKRPRSGP
jgi:HSP20 family molecular chaperone IbpA